MNQPPQPGKRIVSRGEYVCKVGNKVGTSAFGLILLFFCVVGVLTALLIFPSTTGILAGLLVLGLLGSGSLYLGYLGQRTIKEAKQIDTGVPLSRVNAADMPAPDTLVRASVEPMQQQKAVLLRAAQGTETAPEQLVRASSQQS